MFGNCLRKERTQRGKECQSSFPQIFSISCPRSLPPSSPPLLGNLSEKAQNKAAKRKEKTSESSFLKKEEGKRKKGITLLWLLLRLLILSQGGSAGLVVLNAFAIFFNGVTFLSSTTGACLTGFGKDATWPKCTLASCKILARERCLWRDTPGSLGFYVAIWLQLWTSWTDTLDFPSTPFILWVVSLRKQGSVSCGWSCNGTKMSLCWINSTRFVNNQTI